MSGIAYSYVRFSTPEQRTGDSLRRQLSASRKWADDNGFELDDTMRDEGLSGYHGKHLAATAHLGNFLARIRAGEIAKGSVLIVEHLDRLGRDDVEDALARFIDIKKSVDIVTLMDGQRYSRTDPWHKLIIAIAMMAAANESSATKAKRIKETWSTTDEYGKPKEGRRTPGRISPKSGNLSMAVPSWIIRTPDGFKIDEVKANVVRRIFRDLVTVGMHTLAQRLNAEGVPTLNPCVSRTDATWDASTIKALVRSRKALGEQSIGKYTNGKREDTGESVINAYPAVITEAEWFATQQAIDSRSKGGASAMTSRNGNRVTNLFGGLARCALCDNRMVVSTRGRGTHFYLGCSMAKTGKCSAKKFHRLDGIEAGIVKFFAEAAVTSKARPMDDPAARMQIELDVCQAEAARLDTLFAESFALHGNKPADSLYGKALAKLENDHKAKLAQVKRLESSVAARRAQKPAKDQFDTVRRLLTGLQGLHDAKRIEARAKVSAALPGVLKALTFQPDGRFMVNLVDDLPASLPANASGEFVRAFRQVGNSYEFDVSGLLAPRIGKLPAGRLPDVVPVFPLPQAALDHLTVIKAALTA